VSAGLNEEIAGRLDEAGQILAEQGANRFRVEAYHRAAATVRALTRPVSEIFEAEGMAGLEKLPGIGMSIARAIRDLLHRGRWGMLERLRGQSDPEDMLATVPGIGPRMARRLHEELGLESLEDLEMAAHDGRLSTVAGLGAKRLAGIRDTLAQRLGRVRHGRPESSMKEDPPVSELLDVDHEYRQKSEAGELRKIAPRRFNPKGEAWLPVLHTSRGERHYTALFSNTARAHEFKRTGDWVVLYVEEDHAERQFTVVTAERGPMKGERVVRGRELECERHYHPRR